MDKILDENILGYFREHDIEKMYNSHNHGYNDKISKNLTHFSQSTSGFGNVPDAQKMQSYVRERQIRAVNAPSVLQEHIDRTDMQRHFAFQ